MTIRTHYDRFEVIAGTLMLAAAIFLSRSAIAPAAATVPEVLRWAGVLLLMQGLFRDVAILLRRRGEARDPEARRGWLLCVESTVGLGLILLSGLFAWADATRLIALPLAGWTALVALWWLFGWATRELVLELRRDPDHLNLLFGRPRG